jgi:hypothetical protein
MLIERNAMLPTCDHVFKNNVAVMLLRTFLDVTATLRLCDGAVKAVAEVSAQRIDGVSAMDTGERLS